MLFLEQSLDLKALTVHAVNRDKVSSKISKLLIVKTHYLHIVSNGIVCIDCFIALC